MRLNFSLIFSFLFLMVCSHTPAAELISPYFIAKRSTDSTLDAGKGIFVVKFIAPNGKCVAGAVNITLDNCSINQTTDTNGKVHFGAVVGKHVIYFSTYSYEEIKTDTIVLADRERIEITVNFDYDDMPRPMKKPVIYVYAGKETPMSISLDLHGYPLLFSYPEHNTGWNFIAKPGGEIQMDGKLYNYLFWEGGSVNVAFRATNVNEGYCVKKTELLAFLENSLDKMGFNTKEKQDFITFWYPQMKENEMNYIRFIFNDDCNVFANLACNPQPTVTYRMSMLWTAVNCEMDKLKPQKFPVIQRKGLTVIEWGGGNVKEDLILNNFIR